MEKVFGGFVVKVDYSFRNIFSENKE